MTEKLRNYSANLKLKLTLDSIALLEDNVYTSLKACAWHPYLAFWTAKTKLG